MKKVLYSYLFLAAFPLAVIGKAPPPELTQDFWNDPAFVRGFMGDYGFRSEVEPRIDKSEQFILREVVAKAENQLEEATLYLESKINDKTSAALDFALGTMFYQLGRLTRSEQTYEQALKKFPSFLRARKNLGFVQLSLGKLDAASQNLAKAISLGEADGISYVALGYCHLSLGRVVSAENAYRMAILLHPDSIDARNGLVNCLLSTNRFAEALALLDELLESKPNDLFCHKARASALQGMGREEDAVIALETLRRMNQLDAAGTLSLGDLYHNLGLHHLSLSAYQQSLAKKEKLSLARYARAAKVLINRGSYGAGFRYLEEIEKTFGKGYSDADEREIRMLQAEVRLVTGKRKEAADLLEELITKQPLDGEALILSAKLAMEELDYAKAALRFERAAKLPDFEVDALIEHGRMLVGTKEYQKASDLLERAQSLAPQPRVARYLQAINNLNLSARKNP
ncbi:MAG: tetratricopeptide repeat protein [Opitutae bacterium]